MVKVAVYGRVKNTIKSINLTACLQNLGCGKQFMFICLNGSQLEATVQ